MDLENEGERILGEKERLDVGALERIDILENFYFWKGIEKEKKRREERGKEKRRELDGLEQ